ncbi:hypothetical protein [Helicobacter rodentium]|uniref:hypothetical protein n=1 Tax=Helicobacter rodentium TaxID=59617 RepID=UPI000479DFF6|nr:hypothetical protein [Helicobacter rodentium]
MMKLSTELKVNVDSEIPNTKYEKVANRISSNIKEYHKLADEIVQDTMRLKELGYVWYLSDDVAKTIEIKKI